MEKDLNDSVDQNSSCLKDSESDKSFVGKFKSIINNTPLSKWFRKQDDNRSTIRRRDEVFEDEDISEMQPPSKRVKLPTDDEGNSCNNILFNETHNIPINNVINNTFNSFSEPVAGPSGIKSRKLLSNATKASVNSARNPFSSTELLNGHKDSDSEESTSGYSSVARIGSKEQVCGSQESSKQTSPLQNSPTNSRSLFNAPNESTTRSLFAERSLSPNMNTSLSSRRPSFNASTFGSPNFVDKTISTKRIINSPFYNGRTIYGGASAYGRKLGRSSQDLKTSLRNSVRIKPVNKTAKNGNLVLGKTARRILDTLEQYSSPVNDAKKIPIAPKKLRHDGLLTKYTGANPYIRESKVSSNKELHVPSVSDLLKMKHKTQLQDSTEAVRQIATSSKSDLNSEYYKINTNENEKEKHTGKIKTKIASVRQKPPSNDTINDVHIIPVSLPITTLPKFDLIIPPPGQAKKVPETPTQSIKQVEPTPTSKPTNAQPSQKITETETNVQIEKQTTTSTIIEYKFSDPLVIAENVKSIVAINDFKFSEPLCKKSKTDSDSNVTLNFKMPENKLPSLLPKKTIKNSESPVKVPATLKTGSVMDILGKKDESLMEKFKPAQGSWECSACMIRNQPDKTKCVACETPKLVPTEPTENKQGFGNQFKMSSDKWECNSCMVRNNNSDSKCVACTTSKPNTSSTPKEVNATTAAPLSGFGDKFKPSSNTWECTVCMVRNKSELTKCAACESPNPKLSTEVSSSSSFDSKFKSPPNSWECTSCLVRNTEEASKCVACETPKSGQKTTTGFGNTFKTKDDEWECGVCMVRNKTENAKCQCCDAAKPGSATKGTPLETANDKKQLPSFNFGIGKTAASGFSFGIPSTAATSLTNTGTNASSIFGETAAVTAAAPATFSFGIPAEPQGKPKSNEPIKPTEPTKTPVLQTGNSLLKPNEKLPEKSEPAPATFKFGASTPAPQISNKDITVQKSDALALATSNSVASKPTFNFKPATANGDVTKSGLLFGSKQNTSDTALNTSAPSTTNLFNFVAKPAATAASLAPTPATQSSQTVSTKPLFSFGSNSHSAVKSPTSSFGLANSTATTLNNGFGTTSTPPFGTKNTSSFEVPKTNSTEIKLFMFNTTTAATGEPANKAPMFSFGSSAGSATTTEPSKTGGFNFTTTSTPGFNFSGGKADTPSFNAPPANNVFGMAAPTTGKNGTFNFGSMASNNNSQKAGFSFGAAINNTTAPPAQPGFSFGAPAATPAPSSGGFNFTGAPPTFNASAKPTFNFTDGNMTAFSAQPSTDTSLATAPRKIKRAVRRTQR